MHKNQFNRRLVLKGAGLLMLSGAAGPFLLSRQARAGLQLASSNAAGFVTVSQALTGRAALDPALAQGLYRAFQLQVADFDATLLKLQAALAQEAGLLQGDTTAFAEAQKAERALSQAILQAWYLGVVGKGKKAVCVTFTEALSNRLAAPILVPPSYSYGPIGTWSAQP